MDSHPKPAGRYRNWLDLPLDVTSSKFRRPDVVEILTSAQMVCLHWRNVCKDPSMWRTLNVGHFEDSAWRYGRYDLQKICHRAVDLSCGQLARIEVGLYCDEFLLKYITERSRELRYLGLAWSFSFSYKGWSEVAANVPLLEEFELSDCYSPEILIAFGRSCPRLKSLRLSNSTPIPLDNPFRGSDLMANAIAENMPGLVSLHLVGNRLTDYGLQAILEGRCPRLQSLELRHCRYVTMNGDFGRRCSERIKDLRFHYFSDQEFEKILSDIGYDVVQHFQGICS